jgi:AcrR family transcriptional regulator
MSAKRHDRPSARRPARRLTRGRIVAAALRLVDADGLSGLSFRRLAAKLGCEAMSLYHHFPGKQHLLDALVDHAITGYRLPPAGPDPERRLRLAAYAYRDLAHRHPRLFPLVALHRLNTPAGVRFIEEILAVVEAVAPGREAAARGFRALGYYLMGAALDETSGYARGPSAALPVDADYIERHCPRLAAAAPYFQPAHWDRTFDLGLEALIAALRAPPRVAVR